MAITPYKFRVPIDMGLLEILSLRLEQLATDPTILTNGRVWYNTTEHRAKRIENGVIVPFFSAVDAVKLAAYESEIDAAAATAQAAQDMIDVITDDDMLAGSEKSVIKAQYDLLLEEQEEIDDIATLYGITTELTNYDTAISNLTAYINSLSPALSDYTQNTIIDGVLFRQLFGYVYITRQILSNAMSTIAHTNLDTAISISTAAQNSANAAVITANEALAAVGVVANDSILARQEKPFIVQQVNVINSEHTGIHTQADDFGITTELTAYDNAVTALTTYLNTLNPAWDLYTVETPITRVTFNSAFELVYSTRQAVLNAIAAAAGLAADTAAIIANSKKRHFIVQPTTPYEVGDLWSNAVDLYRCITQRLTGVFVSGDWEVATHYDRTKTTIDGGLITTGRVEVGGGLLGEGNAGMNGSVSLTPTTDIRFWAGSTYAGRDTAPWRIQNDGTFYATLGRIGGWYLADDAIYTGAKHITDGLSSSGITLAADGSIHAPSFFIDADGTIGMSSLGSIEFVVDANSWGLKMQGGAIWENSYNADTGAITINYNGYNGGTTRYRDTIIGDGKGNVLINVDGSDSSISFVCTPYMVRPVKYATNLISNGTTVNLAMTSQPIQIGTYSGTMNINLPYPITDGVEFKFVNYGSGNMVISRNGGPQILNAGSLGNTISLAQYKSCTLQLMDSYWVVTEGHIY